MPFMNPEETVNWTYVNEKDPNRQLGLEPRTWNIDEGGIAMYPNDPRLVEGQHSIWRFAAFKNLDDDDLISRKVSKTNIRYDARKARKQGRDYSPEFEQETLMNGLLALITTMSRGWDGPEFVIPDWAKDEAGRPHPQRGRKAPCNVLWIGKYRHPLELRALELYLQGLYEPEGAAADAEFQGATASVDGSPQAGILAEIDGQPGRDLAIPA